MKPSNRISPLTTLPPELKAQIALFLPINDWFSLRLANSVWKFAVTNAATLYLTSTEKRLPQLMAKKFDFDLLWQEVLEKFKPLGEQFIGVTETKNRLTEMNDLIKNLQDPIARFLFLKEQLKEQLLDTSQQLHNQQLSNENNYMHAFLFRSGFLQSFPQQFKNIIQPVFDTCIDFSDSLWFKKMLTCIKLCPEHSLAQRWTQATSKIEELKATMSYVKAKEKEIQRINDIRERERKEAQRREELLRMRTLSFSLFSMPRLKISFPPSLESMPNSNMKRNP